MGYVCAIVPAAGLGKRLGAGTNKTLAMLLDKPILIWTLSALEASGMISEIIPVLNESDMAAGEDMIEAAGFTKVKRIAAGGRERQDSVMNGLKLIDDKSCTVLIHDGARPLLSASLIADAIGGLAGFDGAISAVPPKDTIKEADGKRTVVGTLRRDSLWAVQTPQVFHYGVIMDAYLSAMGEGWYTTDDSALVERRGGKVNIVMGSYENIKITTPEDMEIAAMLLKRRASL